MLLQRWVQHVSIHSSSASVQWFGTSRGTVMRILAYIKSAAVMCRFHQLQYPVKIESTCSISTFSLVSAFIGYSTLAPASGVWRTCSGAPSYLSHLRSPRALHLVSTFSFSALITSSTTTSPLEMGPGQRIGNPLTET